MNKIKYKKMTKRMKNLTGYKIGTLTVIKYLGVTDKSQTVWECLCECGNIKNYTISELSNNKSCGCKKYSTGKDIIGKKFGRLTVIEKIGKKNRHSIYKCLCECGNYTTVYRSSLTTNDIKSCGCLQDEFYKNRAIDAIKKYQVEGTNVAYIKSDKLSKSNKSGIRGVYQKKNGKWCAQIMFKRKCYNLGTFVNKEDAIKARKDAEEKINEYLRKKCVLE